MVDKKLGGQPLELKKRKEQEQKNRFKSYEGCKKIRDSQVSYITMSDSEEADIEKLNFRNIMDLQLKFSTSKATSTTVQDVHLDIGRGIRKSPGKLILYA